MRDKVSLSLTRKLSHARSLGGGQNLKIRTAALAGGLAALGVALGASQAHAQAAPFLDTPTNHWAYESVQDLAKRGIVIGYPDGTYGGKRPMTRYEFAVAIERALMTIDAMVKAQQGQTPPPGTPPPTDADSGSAQ